MSPDHLRREEMSPDRLRSQEGSHPDQASQSDASQEALQIKKPRRLKKAVPSTGELVPPEVVALHSEEDSDIDEQAWERRYYYSKKTSKYCCLFFGCSWAGTKKRRLEEHLKRRHDWHVEVQGPATGRRLQAQTKQKRRPGRDLSQYVQRYRVDAEHRWKVNRAAFLKRARANALAYANALLDHMDDGTEKELAVQKYVEGYVERSSMDWDRDRKKKIAQYQKNIKETYNVDGAGDRAEAYPTTPLSKLAVNTANLSIKPPGKARVDEGKSSGEASNPALPVHQLQKLPFSIVNKHPCTDPLVVREGNSDRMIGVDRQDHKIYLADGWVKFEQKQGLERGDILPCKLYESSTLWVEKTGKKIIDYKHTTSAIKTTPNFKKEKLSEEENVTRKRGRSETSSNKTLKEIIQAARERLPNDLYYLIEFTESLVTQSGLNLPLCFAANISVKNGDSVDVTVPGCESERIEWYEYHNTKRLGSGWTKLVLLHHIKDEDWALLEVTNKTAITFHIYHHKNPSSVSAFREELERCLSDSFEACEKGNHKAKKNCKEPINRSFSVEMTQDMLHQAPTSKITSNLNGGSLFEEVNMTRKSETDIELKEMIKAARERLDGRFYIMEFTWARLKHGRSNIPALFAANLSVTNGDTVAVVVPGCKNQHLKWYSDPQFKGFCGPDMRNFIISNDIQVGDWALLQVTGQKKVITFHIYHCKNPSSVADFREELEKHCNNKTKICEQGNHGTLKQPAETSRNITDLRKALKSKASQYCEDLTNPFICVEMTEDRLVKEFTIGASFILKHMEKGEHVHFRCSDGCSHKFEWTWRQDLIKIWSGFVTEHSLKPADQLVLEVSDPRILKVHIFRYSSSKK